MIVLDEHLLDPKIKKAIERWYEGKVCSITDLRPGTIIHDDAVPTLLRRALNPSFVTINVGDFWRKSKPDKGFFIACLQVPESEDVKVPRLIRRLFRLKPFQTKKDRMGKIAHVGAKAVSYYSAESWAIQEINW